MIARELVARQLVREPQVSLFIEEYATQGITVYGEVANPGVYPLMGPHRLYDAISAAGGLTMKAGRTVTILQCGETEIIPKWSSFPREFDWTCGCTGLSRRHHHRFQGGRGLRAGRGQQARRICHGEQYFDVSPQSDCFGGGTTRVASLKTCPDPQESSKGR